MEYKQRIPDQEARSPWSTNKDKEIVKINPATSAVNGTIRLAGSKSLTNRALIIAALAEGTSKIEGILKSDDTYWCIDCLTKLGIKIVIEGEIAYVEGCGGKWPVKAGELYVGASGTLARFLPGALAVGLGKWTLSGSSRLSERPLAPLLETLLSLGTHIENKQVGRSLPLTLEAKGIQGGAVVMQGSTSSQFISGLLLAAPYAKELLTVHLDGEVVQRDYVEMTLEMMRKFGVTPIVTDKEQSIHVPKGIYRAQSIQLEPDISNCCYFWALAALTGGRIRMEGMNAATTLQPDIEFLDVLERMGCTVHRGNEFIEVHGTRRLKGGFKLSMKKWSDQTLTLAVISLFADGPITMTDAAHIRHHECDRVTAICMELRKLSIQVDEHHDGLTVYPGQPLPALLDSHDDHRMAMALSLIGARVNDIQITDPSCVSKTCPDYFERMSALGIQIEYGIEEK